MSVDALLFLRHRTDNLHGTSLDVELDMIGMRQRRLGIGDAEPFSALELLFPSELVVHGRFEEPVVLLRLLLLDRAQHLGEEPWCFRHQVLLRGCGQWFRCGRDRVARPTE